MEVHHPHHPTHKKKWSEYIIEFLMLFAAVTLGFFAENYREHQIEKHREIQYLKNIHLDLKLENMKEPQHLLPMHMFNRSSRVM